jgi:phosphate transport system substrate-binding protein
MMKSVDTKVTKIAVVIGLCISTVGCGGESKTSSTATQQASGTTEVSQTQAIAEVTINGSSTVYPITSAIAKDFTSQSKSSAPVTVKFSGTSGGFKKFCAGETDINNASRPILKAEITACNQNNVRFIEIPVAFDALTIAVNPKNTWAKDITIAELKKIWEPSAEGKITNWKQIRSSYPDKPLKLYGAGDKSGTFDYFNEAIVGDPKASRKDYTASEDDVTLVKGVIEDEGALGYFGFAYYEDNQSKLKALGVDSGKGAVLPSRQTVEKSQYQPLSRPLFIYVNAQSSQSKPALKQFVEYYLQQAAKKSASVGYIPLAKEAYKINSTHFYQGKFGTVFGGEAQLNLTLDELLRQEAKF